MAEFQINYYYMGQGDCILIKCPDGKLVMIDCGSSKGVGAGSNVDLLLAVCTHVRALTRKNNGKIDILILTHKDKDHYNQVKQIFSSRTITEPDGSKKQLSKVNIDDIYFSSPSAKSASYAMTQFKVNNCGNEIIGHAFQTDTVNQVFINASEQELLTYYSGSNFELSHGTSTPIAGKRLTLLNGTTAGKNWSVSIIAGQVPETDNDSDDLTNALSLVTLLEFGTSKGLFLGDATKATEAYLMQNQKSLIKNCDFVHIPHHGSRTSSGSAFVNLVKPKGAEVTHETFETGNRLPKEDVLDRYLSILKPKGAETHKIDYWQQIKRNRYESILKIWQQKYSKYLFVGTNGVFFLKIPPKYNNDFVFIYRTKTQYWGLYRGDTTKNLWATGATGFVQWTLPL